MVAKPAGAPGANVTYNSSIGSGPKPAAQSNINPYGYPSSASFNPQPQGNGSKPAWEEVKPRNPYVPNNGNPGGANNMRRPPGEYDRRPRPRTNMPGQPGYNSRMPVRGIQQPGMEMFDQDSTGRMTVRQNPRPGLPSGQQVIENMVFDQQPGWNGPGNHPEGRYTNNPYRPGNSNYYGGQSAGAGRYRPPMMDGRGGWQDYGGFNYNLPNAFGSYPGYGQGNPYSQFYGSGYEGLYGNSQGNPYGDFMSFYASQNQGMNPQQLQGVGDYLNNLGNGNPYDVPYGG